MNDLFNMLNNRDLLDIYVGTDEHIIKKEDLPLLRLQNLSPLSIHSLNKCFTKDQWPLLWVQLLKGTQQSDQRQMRQYHKAPILWSTEPRGHKSQKKPYLIWD